MALTEEQQFVADVQFKKEWGDISRSMLDTLKKAHKQVFKVKKVGKHTVIWRKMTKLEYDGFTAVCLDDLKKVPEATENLARELVVYPSPEKAAEIFDERFVCMDLDCVIGGELDSFFDTDAEFKMAQGTDPR